MPRARAVVGHVEQAAQEGLVAGDAFAQPGVALGCGRRVLHHEAALRADRHDHRVLHHLRLHQAEHFGAEVLAPVRPAQAAARDAAAAQMHAFDARRVDPDFEHRFRLGQARHLRRIELERQIRLRLAVGVAAEVVGAHGRVDDAEELPQDAVFVEIRHLVERRCRWRRAASCRTRASRAAPRRRGSKRATNSSTSLRAIAGLPVSARSMYASLKVEPTCRRYLA